MRRVFACLALLTLVFLPVLAQDAVDPTMLFDKQFDFWDCDWSPDGTCMALAGKEHSQSIDKGRIWLFTIGGADKPILWTNTNGLFDDWPRWSPDGSRLAMIRKDLQTMQGNIWLKELATGVGRRLTDGEDDRQPSWSPDGLSIVFRRRLNQTQSLLAVADTTSGQVKILTKSPAELGEPCWGADGLIYYTRYVTKQCQTTVGNKAYQLPVLADGRIWRYDPVTGRDEPAIKEDFDQRMPSLSPDGKWLAFYGQCAENCPPVPIPDPGGWALYVRNQATGGIRKVLTDVSLTGGPPRWSPNGRTVVFFSLRGSQPGLWSYDVLPDVPLPGVSP